MVHFKVMRDMILKGKKVDEPSAVNVHEDKKIERKWARCATVAIVTEPEDKCCRISLFNRRR